MDPAHTPPAAPPPADAELLRRCAQGDRAAFGQLVTRHERTLYRLALRLTPGAPEAEDALQEALLAAWRFAPGFRGDAAVRTWLVQILVHACRQRARRKMTQMETDAPGEAQDLETPHAGPESVAAARQLGRALEKALATLEPEAREVLLLRDVEGLKGEEVAEVLQISLAAMKSRLHRARLELKAQVEGVLGHALREELS